MTVNEWSWTRLALYCVVLHCIASDCICTVTEYIASHYLYISAHLFGLVFACICWLFPVLSVRLPRYLGT